MRINPEFRRNLWLELSPYRLASMPLILAAVFFMAFVTDDYRFAGSVASAAVGLFFLITLIWGTKLASEAVMNEIREHTWDGQRMSILTPWQLAWGKLFGSTVYTWYGAGICLVVYLLAMPGQTAAETVKTLLSLLFAALLAHAVSMLASLMVIQKERKFNRSQTTAILLVGIIAAGPFFSFILDRKFVVEWYGNSYGSRDFVLGTVAFYALWAVIGLYKQMRLELQLKNSPAAWYGFLLFAMIHAGGFSYKAQGGGTLFAGARAAVLAAYFVAVTATYFMAFAERKDLLSLQRVVASARGGDLRRFVERAPRWFLTLPVVALTGLLLVLTARTELPGTTVKIASFAAANFFFLGRDLGIMLFCNLARSNRRADLLTVLYLVMLYGIFPAILGGMNQEGATALFWPWPDQSPFLVGAAGLAEMLLVLYLVSVRWQKRVAEMGN